MSNLYNNAWFTAVQYFALNILFIGETAQNCGWSNDDGGGGGGAIGTVVVVEVVVVLVDGASGGVGGIEG